MKRITTLMGLVTLLFAMAVPAASAAVGGDANDEPYVLAVWETVEAPPDHFSETQTLHTWKYTSSRDLDQLDGALECGSHYQIDLYHNSSKTDDLLEGRVLHGPNDPPEDLVQGGKGTAWKFVSTDECADVQNLNLTYEQDCRGQDEVRWRVTNPNDFDVSYDVRQAGSGYITEGATAAPGESHFTTSVGAKTLILEWNERADGTGDTKSKTKAGGDTFKDCFVDVVIEKDWTGSFADRTVEDFSATFTIDGDETVYEVGDTVEGLRTGDSFTLIEDAELPDNCELVSASGLDYGPAGPFTEQENADTLTVTNEVLCTPPTQGPQVEVTATEWVDGEFECDDTTVEQTREVTTTTTTYTYDAETGEFVIDEVSEETVTETRTRDLTDEDFAELDCTDVLGITDEADPVPAPAPEPEADPVVMDEPEVKAETLPNAGIDSTLLLIAGSGLLALGGSILLLAARRRGVLG